MIDYKKKEAAVFPSSFSVSGFNGFSADVVEVRIFLVCCTSAEFSPKIRTPRFRNNFCSEGNDYSVWLIYFLWFQENWITIKFLI